MYLYFFALPVMGGASDVQYVWSVHEMMRSDAGRFRVEAHIPWTPQEGITDTISGAGPLDQGWITGAYYQSQNMGG